MKCFETAPAPVQEYVLDDAAMAAEDTAREKLGFEHDVWERIMSLVWDQVFLRIPEQDFRSKLAQIVHDHDLETAERIILRYVVLPLADMVPWDVERRLQDEVQKLTDRFVAEIDKALAAKEVALMAV